MPIQKVEIVKGTYESPRRNGKFSYQAVNPGPELTEFLFGNKLHIQEETREGTFVIYENNQISELQYTIESHELSTQAVLRDNYQSHFFKNGTYKSSIIQENGKLEEKIVPDFKIPEPKRTELNQYNDPILQMLVGDYL